jgi:chromosome segregation ATPase
MRKMTRSVILGKLTEVNNQIEKLQEFIKSHEENIASYKFEIDVLVKGRDELQKDLEDALPHQHFETFDVVPRK